MPGRFAWCFGCSPATKSACWTAPAKSIIVCWRLCIKKKRWPAWGAGWIWDVEPMVHITVVQSLAKGEKLEQVIQHGTEIGVSRFLLVQTERSVMRLEKERERARMERWRRIAKEAAEQAHRAKVPAVDGILSLPEALQQVAGASILTLHPDGAALSLAEWLRRGSLDAGVAVIVGPEGGLTNDEVLLCQKHGATTVSLMPRVLRTETAALVAVSQILLCDSRGISPKECSG
jgi:conserved hypothetical protein TIGR00046